MSVDSVSLPGYPLQRKGYNYNDYYYKFLKETHFFDNPFSPGPMTYDEFKSENFLLVENLQRYKIYNGDLVAKLKFKGPLNKKLFLYMCPIYQKKLTFDEFLNVTVLEIGYFAECPVIFSKNPVNTEAAFRHEWSHF